VSSRQRVQPSLAAVGGDWGGSNYYFAGKRITNSLSQIFDDPTIHFRAIFTDEHDQHLLLPLEPDALLLLYSGVLLWGQ
jgi:hypothetical protein